jgi:hypothetical protein
MWNSASKKQKSETEAHIRQSHAGREPRGAWSCLICFLPSFVSWNTEVPRIRGKSQGNYYTEQLWTWPACEWGKALYTWLPKIGPASSQVPVPLPESLFYLAKH